MAFHGFSVWANWLWKKCYTQSSGGFSRRSELCWIFWHRVYCFSLHYFAQFLLKVSSVDFRKILVWVDLSINELFWFRNWIRTSRVFSHKQHFKIAWTGLLSRWQRKDVRKCNKHSRYFGFIVCRGLFLYDQGPDCYCRELAFQLHWPWSSERPCVDISVYEFCPQRYEGSENSSEDDDGDRSYYPSVPYVVSQVIFGLILCR